jgi:hypothetical protein
MGRAQGQVQDKFSDILGERRGLRADQESASSAPIDNKSNMFTNDSDESYRLMEVLEWMLEGQRSSSPGKFNVNSEYMSSRCAVYMSPQKRTLLAAERLELIQHDLDTLVELGLIVFDPVASASPVTTYTTKGAYKLTNSTEWSDKCQEEFAAWNLAGRPKWSRRGL